MPFLFPFFRVFKNGVVADTSTEWISICVLQHSTIRCYNDEMIIKTPNGIVTLWLYHIRYIKYFIGVGSWNVSWHIKKVVLLTEIHHHWKLIVKYIVTFYTTCSLNSGRRFLGILGGNHQIMILSVRPDRAASLVRRKRKRRPSSLFERYVIYVW